MTINSRQFTQLSEMGISLWQSRTLDNSATESVSSLGKPQAEKAEIDLSQLSSTTLFNDMLLALNLSLGEITVQAQHLDLGLFNWQFHQSDIKAVEDITYQNNLLTTPSLAILASSVKLKRQLWQTISQQVI